MNALAGPLPPSFTAKCSFKREGGLRCPECGTRQTGAVDSRVNKEGWNIRRRRICINGHRFTTYEIVEPPEREWSSYEI